MEQDLLHRTHPEVVKRLRRAEGHLRATITMIEAGRSCLDLAQQLHAVEKAIAGAKRTLIHDHVDHCLESALDQAGREQQRSRATCRTCRSLAGMLRAALSWLGLAEATAPHTHHGGHDHHHGHGHTHGAIDPSIATTERGIWAIKWTPSVIGR